MTRSNSLFLAAAAAGLLSMMAGLPAASIQPAALDGAFSPSAATQTGQRSTPPAGLRASMAKAGFMRALWGSGRRTRYPRPGWSVKQGQRMARKRRNQAQARRAARG